MFFALLLGVMIGAVSFSIFDDKAVIEPPLQCDYLYAEMNIDPVAFEVLKNGGTIEGIVQICHDKEMTDY